MALSLRCPKCETSLREGARRCPLCGTPLRTDARFAPADVGDPVSDPLIGLFDRDEMVRSCPECRNEFAREAKRCGPCRLALTTEARSRYVANLIERPIAARGRAVSAAPPPPPKDSRRVRTCADVDEADALIVELRNYGVDAWVADDAAEPDADDLSVDVYARADDLTSAEYVLGSGRAFAAPSRKEDARTATLRRARAYLAHGRRRAAAALARVHAGDPDAEGIVADALIGGGRMRDAERRAADAATATSDPAIAAKLLRLAGVAAALGADGSPFGRGARPESAVAYLDAATAARPRDLSAGKALFEALLATKATTKAIQEARRLRRLCPNLLATDGWFRDAMTALEDGATPI